MGSEEHLKMELCSGKGLEMLYFTNEIMKQRVSGLGEEHRKLYKFFSDYYRELNTAPLIEDMVLEMRASSKEKVYSLLSDLAAAGCLTAWDGEKRMRPSVSPEEAAMWCGDDSASVNERMCLIRRAVTVFYFMKGGAVPAFSDFMKPYRDSSLYLLIREQAEPYFYSCVRIVKDEDRGTAADMVQTASWV